MPKQGLAQSITTQYLGGIEDPENGVSLTGSMTKVSITDTHGDIFNILVDAGGFQGCDDNEAMNKSLEHLNPGDIDAIIITHAHIDHIGRLPFLVRNGFQGPIYMSNATAEIAKHMWEDQLNIWDSQEGSIKYHNATLFDALKFARIFEETHREFITDEDKLQKDPEYTKYLECEDILRQNHIPTTRQLLEQNQEELLAQKQAQTQTIPHGINKKPINEVDLEQTGSQRQHRKKLLVQKPNGDTEWTKNPKFKADFKTLLERMGPKEGIGLQMEIKEIQNELAAKKAKKNRPAIYSKDDVNSTLSMIKRLDKADKKLKPESIHRLENFISVAFLDAGHVHGSVQALIKIAIGHQKRNIQTFNMLFTGDLGRMDEDALAGKPQRLEHFTAEKVHYVQADSTYAGKPEHSAKIQEIERMLSAINEIRGNVLIAAFSFQRFQEILNILTTYLQGSAHTKNKLTQLKKKRERVEAEKQSKVDEPDLAELKQALEELKARAKQIIDQKQQIISGYKQAQEDSYEEQRKTDQEFVAQINALHKKKKKIQKMILAPKKLKDLEKTINNIKQRIQDEKDEDLQSLLRLDLQSYEAVLAKTQKAAAFLANHDSSKEALEKKQEAKQNEFKQKRQTLEQDMAQDLADNQAEFDEIQEQIQQLDQQQIAIIRQKIAELEAQIQAISQEYAQLIAEQEEIKKKAGPDANKIAEIKNEITKLNKAKKKKIESIKEQLYALHQIFKKIEEIQQIESQIQQIRADEEKAQSLILQLNNIYADSLLATNINDVMKADDPKKFDFLKNPKISIIAGNEDRQILKEDLMQIDDKIVLVSSGGMLQGGPITGYLPIVLNNPDSGLILTGYQSPDTPGGALVEWMKMPESQPDAKGIVTEQIPINRALDTITIKYRAGTKAQKIVQIDGLSSHASQGEVARYIKSLNLYTKVLKEGEQPKPNGEQSIIALTHGGPSRQDLKQALIKVLQGPGTKQGDLPNIIIPDLYKEQILYQTTS